MLDFSRFNSLISVMNYFTSNAICKSFLAEQRWGDAVVCPYCGSVHIYKRGDGRYKCAECGKSFSATVGTIFHGSNLPLTKWFIAMYLVSSHKKGISSYQLGRDLCISQKSAWFMLQKIRTLYKQETAVRLSGEVEMDEMYLGGKERWKHASKRTEHAQGRSLKVKTPIFGMVQREGSAIILKVADTKSATLMPIIKEYVKQNAHLFTDEGQMYKSLRWNGFSHENCDHANGQYVSDKGASTNCVEGFWSHFRRSIYGIYHQCDVKYLQRYIDEQTFRWNTRKWTEGERFADMFSKIVSIVSYDKVVNDGVIVAQTFSSADYNSIMQGFIGSAC